MNQVVIKLKAFEELFRGRVRLKELEVLGGMVNIRVISVSIMKFKYLHVLWIVKWMSLVESRDEIPLRRRDCDNHGFGQVRMRFRILILCDFM